MKIGILTFYNVANYGAALQAWALSSFIKSLGHDVEFVNHTPPATADNFGSVLKNSLESNSIVKRIVKLLVLPVNLSLGLIKVKKYKKFVKKHLSENKYKDSVIGYDVVVVGSDQVWNYKLTGGYDDFFWGNAPYNGTKPKYIAYAASINQLTFDNEEYVRKSLRNFEAISVREEPAISLLSKYTDKDIVCVSDPTYLIDKDAWLEIINYALIPKGKYLLIYPVGNVEETIRIGKRIAEKRGLKVVMMMSQMTMKQNKESYFFDGPEGFISKLSGATVVVTSSFHGTILSTLFNKDFYSVKHEDGSNDRASSLLNYLGLKDRLVSSYEDCQNSAPIDYQKINSKIEMFRQVSADYLKDSLK